MNQPIELSAAMQQVATSSADWVLILPVVLCLIGAAVLLIQRRTHDLQALFSVVIVAAVLACDVLLLTHVYRDGPLTMTMGNWLPPFGISFAADVMGAMFALAAALVTLVVLIYMQRDTRPSASPDDTHALVLLLLAGVSGAFLTGDLFNLYVWFEVMLIASFGLLVSGGRDIALDATIKYGFLNFLATSMFLAALGLLYGATGTLNMADLIGVAPTADPVAMTGVAALLLLAFATKAGAFPVNAWLPASYHAPSPATSALLGGLLTKVGVYALLRVLVALLPASRDWLDPVITLIAVLTLVIAPLGAIAETNLRRAIGFLLIGGIGATLAGLALPTQSGIAGSVVYVLHAMLTLAALYLVAGLIETMTGQTDTRRMGGLYAASGLLSGLFLVLILAVAGVPPFLGFWPKLLLMQAGVESANLAPDAQTGPDWGVIVLIVALLLNALLTLIAGSRLWAHVFWRSGEEGALSEQATVPLLRLDRTQRHFGLWPTTALVALIVVLGLMPNGLIEGGGAAARTLLATGPYVEAFGLGGNP